MVKLYAKCLMMNVPSQDCLRLVSGDIHEVVCRVRAKLRPPFKVYVYCSKDGQRESVQVFTHDTEGNMRGIVTGAVIGEFICTDVSRTLDFTDDLWGYTVSKLKLYDSPMSIHLFQTQDKQSTKRCKYRYRYGIDPELTNGAELLGGFACYYPYFEGNSLPSFCRPVENEWCECIKPVMTAPKTFYYVRSKEAI